MKTIDVVTKTVVTLDQIAGLLCTGFEGGMTSDWAKLVKKVKPAKLAEFKGDWNEYPLYSWPLTPDGHVTIRDVYTSKDHTLDFPSIVKGLQIMADKYPKHFQDFINENDDAITGDVFIQCCVLGDCIYG